MKQKFLRTLAILVAALAVFPAAFADVTFSVNTTPQWQNAGTLSGAKTMAVSNGKIYIVSASYSTITYVGDGTSWNKFESGYAAGYIGYPMSNDDAGNIVAKSGNSYYAAATQLTVYPAGATSNADKVEIAIPTAYQPGARADFFYAQGNLLSGNGYVWFVPQNTQSIYRLNLVDGAVKSRTEWTHTLGAASSTSFAYMLDDGRIYFHNRKGSPNASYILTVPANGGAVTTSETILEEAQARNLTSAIFTLQGNLILVANAGDANQDISICIKNLTSGETLASNITPFNGTATDNTTTQLSGIASVGTIVRPIKVDNCNYDIYCYSPKHGASVYRVTAIVPAAPIGSLTYEYIKQTVTQPGRQDIKLTWTAPTDATPKNYKIYRDGKLLTTVSGTTLTYTNTNVTSNYTYKVVPIFDGIDEDDTYSKSVTTTEVTFIPIAVTLSRAETFEGYANVQLFWSYPGYGAKPDMYNIYRDGVLVGTSQAYYFYEEKLAEGTHTYYIESVYLDADGNPLSETAISNSKSIEVVARNTNKTTYTLEVIYNYPHEQITGTTPALFDNRNYYRQGAYYNGKWYIAQRSDQLCMKDQGVADGSDYKSTTDALGSNDARGGVVVFSAVDPRTGIIDAKENNRLITILEGTNVGVATDDKGNIFVRQNDDTSKTRLTKTTPTDAGTNTVPTGSWFEDNFSRRLTGAYIYLSSDGYTTPVDVDLTGLNLANNLPDWNTLSTSDGYTDLAYKSQRGRSDYYRIEGDFTSAEGAYLYFSPSKSTVVARVNIKVSGTTATVGTPEYVTIGDYTNNDGVATTCSYGVENYAFPVDGRDTYIGQIRSNGYFGIHGVNDYHPIFTADSRINNSGGTTIEFNNELFIISPQTMHSASSGDFIVTKGIKSDYADVTTADLTNAMPVATYRQDVSSTGSSTNASGNWMFAEYGKLDGTSLTVDQKDQAECIFIYQYVPGERFAKYMLYPNNIFPAPPVAINLDPVYTSEEGATVVDENSATGANETAVDLLRFDGAASWTKPNYDNDGAEAYVYDSYNVKIYAEDGQVFLEQKVALNDANYGNETDGYKFSLDNMWKDRQYFINVSANYVNIADANDTHVSETSYAYTEDGYNGVAAEGTVKVYTNPSFPVWYDENGNLVYKYSHRVDINFNKPEFDGERVEPVTHYEIWLDKDKDGEFEEQLTNFNLMTGIYDPATDANVGTIESQIAVTDGKIVSATYNPSTTKGYALGEKEEAANRTDDYLCVLTFFQVGDFNTNEGAVMGTGDASALNPANWNYQLRSVYAAGNARITTTKTFDMATGTPIYTGVEKAISGANSLKLYPVPTEYLLNIDCDEAIYSVQVYDEAGRLVENFIGNNMNSMQVDLGNLATGYYFVKVNANQPVKILKK